MAYSPLPAKSDTDTLDLTTYTKIKGNFEAGAVDAMAAKGDLFVGTGADAGARLAVGNVYSVLVPDSVETTGMRWQIRPSARVYNNAALDPTPNNWWTLTFNTERWDHHSMHSTVTNTSRLTVPTGGAGVYMIGGNIEFDYSPLVDPRISAGLRILLNGTTILAQKAFSGFVSIDSALIVTTEYPLAVGDYVELQAFINEDVNVKAAGNYSPEFWATWQELP